MTKLAALLALAIGACAVLPASAHAADHFVGAGTAGRSDPANLSWASISEAFDSGAIKGGDVVHLAAGEYGHVVINGHRFGKPVRILADKAGGAHLTALDVRNSSNLVFEGLSIWPNTAAQRRDPLISTSPDSDKITFTGLDLRSTKSAGNYLGWSLRKWQDNLMGGALLEGTENSILKSRFTGLYIAVATTGDKARILGNQVSGFSGDAVRVLGDDSTISGNVIRDCVAIDQNHDDGIQSWSLGPDQNVGTGVVKNMVIDSNIILEWSGPSKHPLRCQLQGIGLFDGFYSNLTVQNNLISVSSYHGISVNGLRNGRIVNNTVVNPSGPSPEAAWIGVFSHESGRPSSDVIIANNAAPTFRLEGDVKLVNNLVMIYPNRDLTAPYQGDFTPLRPGRLIDAAQARHAPKQDIWGNPRNRGGAPDIGAIELQ